MNNRKQRIGYAPPSIPRILQRLLAEERWQHPGDDVLSRVVPFITDPLDFLTSRDEIVRESSGSLADHPDSSMLFMEVRGSQREEPVLLPWRDVDRSLLIAVNRNIGDDVAIALDFRTDAEDPRVIGTHWDNDWRGVRWVEIAPTFHQFLAAIGIAS